MCLAIPGKVEEILTEGDLLIGRVNFGGVVKRVCLDYVPDLKVGDYTLVHVGFALSKIDEETARQTLDDFRAMGVLDAELADEEAAFARAAAAPQSACPDGSCPVFFQVSESKSGEAKSGEPKSGASGTDGSSSGQ
jgi:hydrogenase expression/formation protein HypC